MSYVNTSPLHFAISKTESHLIIVDFMSDNVTPIYDVRQKNYMLKIERSWYIVQDRNTYTNGTWPREHNPKKLKQENKLPDTRNTT